MRRYIWLALVVSCASVPAQVGMSVAEYESSCRGYQVAYQEIEGTLIADCISKPNEYALVEAGAISSIYTATDIASSLSEVWCSAGDASCNADVAQMVYNHTAQKRSRFNADKTDRNNRIGRAIFSAPPANQPPPASTYYAEPAPVFEPPKTVNCTQTVIPGNGTDIVHTSCTGL